MDIDLAPQERAAALAEDVRAVVDSFPPLTPEQRHRIGALLHARGEGETTHRHDNDSLTMKRWQIPCSTAQTDVVSEQQKRLSVCFVCTGNICRSPMAQIVFADALRQEGLAHRVQVSSAGIGAWHVGEPADPRTAEVLRRAGYACEHVATQVGVAHLSADLLVALDYGHLAALRRLVRDPERVVLLRSFDRTAGGRDLDVPDPYYGGRYGFDNVLSMVREAVPGLLAWVRERL